MSEATESDGDFLARLGHDGEKWAAEFVKQYPTVPEDEALGWFCNAIMAGWDASAARFGCRDPMSHPAS
jgi:hypothetical protein